MKKCLLLLLTLVCICLPTSCRNKEKPAPSTISEPTTEYVIDSEALLGAEEVVHHDCNVHGHVFSLATCLQKATCFYCGLQQGDFAPHDWTHATCLSKSTCTVCGAQTGEKAGHLFTKATCAAPASCAVCGAASGSALAHNFRPATCVSPSMCSVCMKKQGSPLGHQWTGGSCTEPKVCTRCKRTLAAPGHQMKGGSCTEDAVCSVCGYTEKAKGHQFVDGVCTVCGKTKQQAVREDQTRTTQSETEVETTIPALDLDPLKQGVQSVRENLQAAHDDADNAIKLSKDESRILAQSSVDHLNQTLEIIDNMTALCEKDERLKSVSDALASVRKAVQKSASISSFYDDTFLKTIIAIRADSTSGLNVLSNVDKALEKISDANKG